MYRGKQSKLGVGERDREGKEGQVMFANPEITGEFESTSCSISTKMAFNFYLGRTGRVGNTGKATSFFDPSDDKNVKVAPGLVHILAEANVEVPRLKKILRKRTMT